jgi:4-amino-4-deoxy-L-arabinose transferase-like glycosyltransferase
MKDNNIFFSYEAVFSKYITFVIFLTSCFFAYFYMLDAFPLQTWDESMFGVQGYEMFEKGDFIVTTFNGQPDWFNAKPPFMIWCIAASYKLFGANLLSLRLPSAIAACLTAIAIFWFVYRYTNNIITGFISGLVLNTSLGFIGTHIAKTGEADAMLAFLITLYLLFFFLYIQENDPKKRKYYLIIFTVSISLATLTKSVAALLMLPGMAIYVIYKKQFVSLIKDKNIYLAVLFFITANVLYYVLRESLDPGYIKHIIDKDIVQRFFGSLDQGMHSHPFDFYILNFIERRFLSWIYLLPVSFLLILFLPDKRQKDLGIYLFIAFLSYLLIISQSTTKLNWYDAPLYPIAALTIGMVFSQIITFFLTSKYEHRFSLKLFACILIFIIPTFKSISYSYNLPKEFKNMHSMKYGDFFEFLKDNKPEIHSYTAVTGDFISNILFYSHTMKTDGIDIQYQNEIKGIPTGQIVVSCEPGIIGRIEMMYLNEVIYKSPDGCKMYKILGLKPDYLLSLVNNEALQIQASREWFDTIKEKALLNKISVKEQLYGDAIYLLQSRNEISKDEISIVKNSLN